MPDKPDDTIGHKTDAMQREIDELKRNQQDFDQRLAQMEKDREDTLERVKPALETDLGEQCDDTGNVS